MTILTPAELQNGYFKDIGGFPPAKVIRTVAEYDGSERCSINCTQLQDRFSERECRQILGDWIDFLRTNTTAFSALHFNSHVPQALFDAACAQTNLTELRCKWGSYADLSALTELKKLQYLYLGVCPSVRDLTPITQLDDLIVLYVENFKHIEDYSPLTSLEKLEQLVISGPVLGGTPIKDLDFIPEMHSLASIWLPNTTIRKQYSVEEREKLHARAPHLQGMHGQAWWLC